MSRAWKYHLRRMGDASAHHASRSATEGGNIIKWNAIMLIVAAVIGAAVGLAFTLVQGNPVWIGVGAVMGFIVGTLFRNSQRGA